MLNVATRRAIPANITRKVVRKPRNSSEMSALLLDTAWAPVSTS